MRSCLGTISGIIGRGGWEPRCPSGRFGCPRRVGPRSGMRPPVIARSGRLGSPRTVRFGSPVRGSLSPWPSVYRVIETPPVGGFPRKPVRELPSPSPSPHACFPDACFPLRPADPPKDRWTRLRLRRQPDGPGSTNRGEAGRTTPHQPSVPRLCGQRARRSSQPHRSMPMPLSKPLGVTGVPEEPATRHLVDLPH